MTISLKSLGIKYQAETFINLIRILSQARNFDKSSEWKGSEEAGSGRTCIIKQAIGTCYFDQIRILQAQLR